MTTLYLTGSLFHHTPVMHLFTGHTDLQYIPIDSTHLLTVHTDLQYIPIDSTHLLTVHTDLHAKLRLHIDLQFIAARLDTVFHFLFLELWYIKRDLTFPICRLKFCTIAYIRETKLGIHQTFTQTRMLHTYMYMKIRTV